MSARTRRHAAILELVREHTIRSQNQLRDLLAGRDIDVAQGTLSRDIRELGLVKKAGSDGEVAYSIPADAAEQTPALKRLAPTLFLSAEGVDHFLVVHTLTGGAQPLAVALDREDWDEILGTIAGDDTILVLLREPGSLDDVRKRLEELAEG